MKKRYAIVWNIFGATVLLLLAAFGFLQSQPGKDLLADWIAKSLSRPGGLEVRIGKISGFLPARIKLESLELGDREGIWLRAESLRLRWAPMDLFSGVVNVEHLGARSVEIERLPHGLGAGADGGETGGVNALEFTLGNLDIRSLRLGQSIAGVPLEYAVHSGGMRWQANGELTGALEVTGDATGLLRIAAPPPGTADHVLKLYAELKSLRKPDIGLQRIAGTASATISREGSSVVLNASADGLALDVDARVSAGEGFWMVDFNRFEVSYLDRIACAVRGSIGSEQVDLEGSLAEFALNQLPIAGISNLTGRISGRIAMTGALAAPELNASLDVFNLTTTQVSLDELPNLNLHIDAAFGAGLLQASSFITNSATGSMSAKVELPCNFSIAPWSLAPSLDRFKLFFNADLDLGVLNGLSMLNDEHIEGRLRSSLTYDGATPQKLVGRIEIADGSYEHYGLGVVVHDIQAELDAGAQGLVVKRMTASDGKDGVIGVAGGVGLWQRGVPLDLKIDIAKARLVRRDEMDATLSGALRLGGLLLKPVVRGKLVVDRAEILLDNIARPAPLLLTNFDAKAVAKAADPGVAGKQMPFALDIEVSMPDQVFVNASVIDSVWGGELKLKDAPGGISVAGVIKPRRGYLSFVGKKFRLLDEGRIDLDGSVPFSPSINILAEYSRYDIVAQLMLAGKLNNLNYTLTSTPAMPEDEVLSYVLFGRDTSSISPYQAFQIAAAARQLSSGVSGGGIMHKMRQVLSIDSLEWREPDTADGRSSVAAGKYLTPGLYVEVKSTLENKEGSTGMMAEYELSRHISVETSTGPQMRPGIGVNWKNDY